MFLINYCNIIVIIYKRQIQLRGDTLLNLKDSKMKFYLIISSYILILGFLLYNFKTVFGFFSSGLSIISPFIVAFGIAFVINLLVKFFEKRILFFLNKSKNNFIKGTTRPLAITLSWLTIIGIIAALITFVLPELLKSVSTLAQSIPGYYKQSEDLLTSYLTSKGGSEEVHKLLQSILTMWKDLLNASTQIIGTLVSHAIEITISITTSVIDMAIALVFSIYLLANKEKLLLQTKKILYALSPSTKVADSIIEVGRLTNSTFAAFISGQCIEAVIIGTLCTIGMFIFRLPYALLIGTLVGATSIIPIFGAFLGTIPSVFIIFLISPIKAFWFIVFILVLQQIEGHLIYPRVVGNSVGLSAIWVILALVIGESVGGVLGIFIGIPLFAVFYKLFGRYVNNKIKKKI